MNLLRMFRKLRERAAEESGTRAPAARPGKLTLILPAASGKPVAERVPSFLMPLFWGTADAEKVTASAKAMTELTSGGSHFADNLLTWGRNMLPARRRGLHARMAGEHRKSVG